ncbi:MAG: exodeoxyribonuclease VII small subunit [Bacteroidales bacterium]|nr:exodeoxyribonuclease VII small subunit [Bacteroidales bacterium]MBD5192031.1 exodeoxyribonuclease VII small subunit [Bacteroidales bacterium]MBD5246062.1 exodeoxyribonuclease VII small subunit [Barnesiella sp.]
MKPVKELTYSEAVAELESILERLKGQNVEIDKLAAEARRATEIIRECRSRLTGVAAELDEILEDKQ